MNKIILILLALILVLSFQFNPATIEVTQENVTPKTIQIEPIINDSIGVGNVTILPEILTPLENLTTILDRDTGSEREYIRDVYNCMHFSIDLTSNLTNLGYDCGCVAKTPKIRGLSGHFMVWINVSNQIYYIEPQNDEIILGEEFISNINSSKYIIREITLEQAKRNEAEQRKWKI